ncbi:MAG: hypothetical protein R6W96_07625, partial [Clostridia bacterium]
YVAQWTPVIISVYQFEIVKTVDADLVEVDDTVNYTITVRNTGNEPLMGVRVVDAMLGLDETVDIFVLGIYTVTLPYTFTEAGTFVNTATATHVQAGQISDTAEVEVIEEEEPPLDIPDEDPPLDIPQTGASPRDILYIMLMLASLGLILGTVLKKKEELTEE